MSVCCLRFNSCTIAVFLYCPFFLGLFTHSDNHVFIVVDGEAKVILGEKSVIVKKNESLFVDGMIPHSIWNNADTETVVVKLSVEREGE